MPFGARFRYGTRTRKWPIRPPILSTRNQITNTVMDNGRIAARPATRFLLKWNEIFICRIIITYQIPVSIPFRISLIFSASVEGWKGFCKKWKSPDLTPLFTSVSSVYPEIKRMGVF